MAAEEGEVKWVKHYSSNHRILLVGEGDFSFSSSLAKEFGSASNIIATSLDTYDTVIKKYKTAKSNLERLKKLGSFLIHGLDATKMRSHPDLKMQKFDRIIFNFPHAGFHGKEDNNLMIDMHKKLMDGFFINAISLLRAEGEVHVSHKTTPPFSDWNIREVAARSCLDLIECSDFKKNDYPGYNQKRGEGHRCEEPFPLGPCSTFKFRFSPRAAKQSLNPSHKIHPQQLYRSYNVAAEPPFVHHASGNVIMPLGMDISMHLLRFTGGYFQNLPETSRISHSSAIVPPYDVLETSTMTYFDVSGCQMDRFGHQFGNGNGMGTSGRTRVGDLYAFHELQRLETLRAAQLQRLSLLPGQYLNGSTSTNNAELLHY